jgi:8-hydroxy-5-deazaflavin:NADPH oxidoreductase
MECFMKLAILGTGAVGSSLGKLLAQSGHSVQFGSRNPGVTGATEPLSRSNVTTIAQAANSAELILIATPWANEATSNILKDIDSFAGKIVIDCTNPLAPDYMSNLIGHTTSSAEQIADLVKPARVVKAFNTIFASVMNSGMQQFNGVKGTGFYCGDDSDAKLVVKGLIEDCGFDPVDAGPLKNARYLEPMAQLNIQIAFGMQGGTDVAFKYMRRTSPGK